MWLAFTCFNLGVQCQSVLYRVGTRLKKQQKTAKNEKKIVTLKQKPLM